MADLLGTGISGLRAFQRSLATTSHNIANVNTEGYNRQRVDLATRVPQEFGVGFEGTGVKTQSITRIYDQFLGNQVRSNLSLDNQFSSYYGFASQIDDLLAQSDTGISSSLQSFFNAVQDVADDPSSTPARQVLLSEAGGLTSQLQTTYSRLSDINSSINTAITNEVSQINSIAQSIADINSQITRFGFNSISGQPNDLLDQRDILLNKLSELTNVSSFVQDNGALNVFIGNGQSLVANTSAQTLRTIPGALDPSRLEVAFSTSTNSISSLLSGGKVGGLLSVRSEVLDPAFNELGRVVLGLADTFNSQHKLGQDLNGALGGDFFTISTPDVLTASSATVSASIVSVSDLTASDYRLTRTGAAYTLTRLSDSTTTTLSSLTPPFPANSVTVDGIQLTLSAGAIADGDSFLIKPTQNVTRTIDVAIKDTDKIAAAAPIRTSATFGNIGDGVISPSAVNSPNNQVDVVFTNPTTYSVFDRTTGATLATGLTYTSGNDIDFNGWTLQITNSGGTPVPVAGDTFTINNGVTSAATGNTSTAIVGVATFNAGGSDPDLKNPVTITFDDPPTTYTVTGSTTGSPTAGITYTEGQPISFNGWTMNITGAPVAGDTFTIGPNTNGVSDNRNALLLGQLQSASTLINGTASYTDVFGKLIVDVGTKTNQADVQSQASKVLLDNAISARDSVSGVNLDEEAADLIRFQQAYQAAARIISTADTLFQTLLTAVGR